MKRRFLNVGGGSKRVRVPTMFSEWEHLLLDIDPKGNPDVCLDARELSTLAKGQFNAIYCSHNLEHYYAHDVARVLAGFHHVLTDDGFADIRVPDMGALFREIVDRGLDIDDMLYSSGLGPVRVRDVIYGFGPEIERSGVDFYAHRTGFTRKSLAGALNRAGFSARIFMPGRNREIAVLAFKQRPSAEQSAALGITIQPRTAVRESEQT